MTGKPTTCRPCEIAGYLEESLTHCETESIRALAHIWHDKCTGCDCEVRPCARGILPFLRSLWCTWSRLHVPRLPGQMGKGSCTWSRNGGRRCTETCSRSASGR